MSYAATIGFFDGVHSGHRFVLDSLKNIASKTMLSSAVITFTEHPQKVLRGTDVPLLTTYAERVDLLKGVGVDEIFAFNFEVVKDFTAADFMRLLHTQCGVELLLMGYDHHFGSDRLSSFADYQQAADAIGLQLMKIPQAPVGSASNIPSSTSIRQALQEGRIEDANALLGYSYSLTGEVVEGRKIGRSIGFPTANIAVPAEKLIPAAGVYSCMVESATPEEFSFPKRPALLNIGTNPTVDGSKLSVELHIPDFSGDLYGRKLTVELTRFIRPEQKFASLDELRRQIDQDLSNMNA